MGGDRVLEGLQLPGLPGLGYVILEARTPVVIARILSEITSNNCFTDPIDGDHAAEHWGSVSVVDATVDVVFIW
jgi:hypothetical protein